MPVTCEERWAAHTACACAALSSSAAACAAVSSSAAAPFAPTSELEEAGAVTFRPVLLADALPFGAVLAILGAGAFLAAGAAKLAAGLPKSVSCGMGLEPRATAAAKRAAAAGGRKDAERCSFFRVFRGAVVAAVVVGGSYLIGCCRLQSSHGLEKRREYPKTREGSW